MGQLPFHRKYRAKRISEYIGNTKIVESMLGVLRSGKRPQVILLEGHAGCGKTSFARLIAKEYLCENRDENTGACGVCDTCKLIEEYIQTGASDMLMNVREIDNSVSGNKQDIDELLNEAEMPSADGNWKVYILDECHLLSHGAQGRLLKMLEEPPEKVLMILCTTDPDKLLSTIISRCQYRFTVTKPKLKELAPLLKRVALTEGVVCDDKALGVISASANFVPREALILLEQVVNERGDVTYQNTVDVLDIVADTYYFRFYELIVTPKIDTFRYIKFIADIKENINLRQFINGLITFTQRGIYVYNSINLEGLDLSEIKRYKKIFSKFSANDIVYILDFLMGMKDDDIETKLLMLGYQGVLNRKQINVSDESFSNDTLLDRGNTDASAEKAISVASYIDKLSMTDEEKENLIKVDSDIMSTDDLANLFGGEVIE